MKLYSNEEGQALVITALCMTVLFGSLAMAIDLGIVFDARRQLQIDADAAATAAALQYLYNGNDQTGAIASGRAAALSNDSGVTPTVSLNANPISPAAHRGCSGTNCYFEAIVTKTPPTIFFNMFYGMLSGSSSNGFTVGARAVAGTPGVSSNCGYLTKQTGIALTTQGKWTITSGCGLYINSSSSDVEDDTGKSAKSGISATSISQVGPLPSNLTIASDSPAQSVQQVLPENIPYSNVTPPSATPCAGVWNPVSPVAGCYAGDLTLTTATFGSGTYVFTGNITVNGTLTGKAITLDINTGSLTIKPGGSSMTFTPPTSGALSGVVIYMPPSNNSTINLEAGSTQVVFPAGWVVAPSATLSEQDNGGGVSVGGLVVSDVNMGPSPLAITGYNSPSSPLQAVSLVE